MLGFPQSSGNVYCGYHDPVFLMYMGYAYSRGRDSISIHRSPDQGETDPNQCKELCVSPGNPNTSSLMLFFFF